MYRPWQRSVCVCSLLLVAAGCLNRDYDGPQRFPLSGSVTYDGEPIDLGTISFIPAGGDKQRVSGGMIEDGKFLVPEAAGANAGTYRVEFHWGKKTGEKYYDVESRSWVDDRREALPDKFHKNSDITVEVSKDKTVFDFDLKSK